MNRTLTGIVVKRLDDSWDWEWREETREAFARAMAQEQVGEKQALLAVDIAVRHERNRRPSIGEFSRDLLMARRQMDREQQAEPRPVRKMGASDKIALDIFFAKYKPRIMEVMAGIGTGPQAGSEALCREIVAEWKEEVAQYEGDF